LDPFLTRLQFLTRVAKPVAWIASLGPAVWIGLAAFGQLGQDLGADPVKTMQVTTGLSCLVLLLVTLTITPARKLTHFSELIRLRRLLGLFAFFYALLHALIYFVFDQSLDPKLIWDDTIEHPRIAVGFVAFLLLIPLAVTSTNGWIRRLGKRWTRLHKLVYLATGLSVLHYLMVQKLDIRTGMIYAGIFALLMIARTMLPKGGHTAREG
jgi:sulfoxide reductase heme-binding subunit YedZ